MKSLLNKLTLVLLMVGFLAACGGDPNIESAKLNLNRSDYGKVLESANAALETNPDNPLGHYYKGIALSELAKAASVDARESGYAEARTSFDRSLELFAAAGQNTNESQYIPLRITQLWADEYNAAVNLVVPDEGEPTEAHLSRAIQHLKSAHAIEPDSIQSLDVASEVYYMQSDIPNAITYLEMAIEKTSTPESYRWLRLTYFYTITEQHEKSLETLNKAMAEFPEDIEVTQELANAYLAMGETDKALEVVRQLIAADPENAQYRLVFGTQIYQYVLEMGDDLRGANDVIIENTRQLRLEERKARPDASVVNQLKTNIADAEALIANLTADIDNYTQQAEDELQVAATLEDDNPIIFNTLGIIYQNRAANLFDRRNATEDLALADRLDSEAREMLSRSLPYYERAAELDAENTDYWMALFRIYTTLGMTEKALEAQEKSGL
jgi:tetratricopeptide (TPR) repeat protein